MQRRLSENKDGLLLPPLHASASQQRLGAGRQQRPGATGPGSTAVGRPPPPRQPGAHGKQSTSRRADASHARALERAEVRSDGRRERGSRSKTGGVAGGQKGPRKESHGKAGPQPHSRGSSPKELPHAQAPRPERPRRGSSAGPSGSSRPPSASAAGPSRPTSSRNAQLYDARVIISSAHFGKPPAPDGPDGPQAPGRASPQASPQAAVAEDRSTRGAAAPQPSSAMGGRRTLAAAAPEAAPEQVRGELVKALQQLHQECGACADAPWNSAFSDAKALRRCLNSLRTGITSKTSLPLRALARFGLALGASAPLHDVHLVFASVAVLTLLARSQSNLQHLAKMSEDTWMPSLVSRLQALINEEDGQEKEKVPACWLSSEEQDQHKYGFVENTLEMLVKTAVDHSESPRSAWAACELILRPPPEVSLPLVMRHSAFSALILRIGPQYNDDFLQCTESLLSVQRLLEHIFWWDNEKDYFHGNSAIPTSDAIAELVQLLDSTTSKMGSIAAVKITKAVRAADAKRKQNLA